MKPIFSKSTPLGIRLFLAILCSVSLILLDGRSNAMIQVRNVLESAVSGLYYFSNTPRAVLDGVSDNFIGSQKLLLENRALKQQLLEKNSDLQLLDQLKVENNRLRLLLNSPLRQDEYKKIVEVLTAEMDAYRQQIIINQGKKDGVFIGQPVIDERGIVGQVISVGETSSRVLLLTDVTHGIPVQVLRNDVRTIANGTGQSELILDNMPRAVDIKQGDVLVTSGLGGLFPEGYPVAIVESVQNNGASHFSRATARPLASLERLRYLLLLWPMGDEAHKIKSLSPQGVRDVVEERRNNFNPLDRIRTKKGVKKDQVTSEYAKEEKGDEEPETPMLLPESETEINHSTEQGAE